MVETHNNIIKQMKIMRQMKQEIQNVLDNKSSFNVFDAFNVEEEDFEKKILKVGMGENDNLVQVGRIKVKNRVKAFTVNVYKSEAVKNLQFKVFVSLDDQSFKTPMEFFLIRESKVQIQVPIHSPNGFRYIYFKFVQIENNDSDMEVQMDTQVEKPYSKYLRVIFNFGINNFTKMIAQQLI